MEPISPPIDLPRARTAGASNVPESVVDSMVKSRQLKGFTREQIKEVAALMRPLDFATGHFIYRQGFVPEGMYVIEDGDVQLWTRWADSRMDLVRFKGGNALCASALLSTSGASASAECLSPCRVWVLEHGPFDGLRAQRHPVAFALLSSGSRAMVSALRGTLTHFRKMAGVSPMPSETIMPRAHPEGRPVGPADAPLLTVLPALRALSPDELETLKGISRLHELPRGTTLFQEGESAGSLFLVLRGAIEASSTRNGVKTRFGLLGPGRLCGHEAFTDGSTQLADCTARERALVLEITRAEFDRQVLESSALALRLFGLIAHELSAEFEPVTGEFVRAQIPTPTQQGLSADQVTALGDRS